MCFGFFFLYKFSSVYMYYCTIRLQRFSPCCPLIMFVKKMSSFGSSGPDKTYGSDAKQSWEEKAAWGARELLHLVYWPLGCRGWWTGRSDQGWHLAKPTAVLPGKIGFFYTLFLCSPCPLCRCLVTIFTSHPVSPRPIVYLSSFLTWRIASQLSQLGWRCKFMTISFFTAILMRIMHRSSDILTPEGDVITV